MPTPRDGFSRIRTTFETGIKQALVPANGRAGNAGTVYARARPSRAEITESYFVHQEISVSPWTKWRESLPPSSGRVELVIPYDGHDYFTRQAGADVAWGAAHQQSEAGTAVIGHLLLKDYGATSLRDDLRLPDSHGAVPIEVPVSHVGSDADGRFDHLSTDRQTGVISHEFVPDLPTVIPAQLEVDLFDPDSLELIRTDLRTEEGRRYVDDVIRKIRQQVSFRNDLILRIVIRLTVPANQDGEDSRPKDRDEESRPRDEGEWLKDDGLRPKGDKLRPEVARMTIGWPTIT